MAVLFRPTRFDRRFKSTASAAALIVGAIVLVPHEAVAGDVTVNSNFDTDIVYGNSVTGSPNVPDIGASLIGNTLTIETGAQALGAYGANWQGIGSAVSDNSVVMTGGSMHDVTGGFADGGASADFNSVEINGGTVSDFVFGSWSTFMAARNSTVSITGGQVGMVSGGYSQSGAATDNTVAISGGTVTGWLIAGGQTITGSATDNTVTISGSPIFTSSTLGLYGGYCFGSCGDVFTGNRLELKTSGLTVASLGNFQYLDFYLPTTLAAGATMLTVTGTADLTDGLGGSSVINVGINGASSPLVVGNSVTLIQAGTLTTDDDLNTTATGVGLQGVTLEYVFGISAMGNNLIATVQSAPTVTDESKALPEGFVSGVSLINQGADLADGKGMANAINAAETGWSSFGAVSGGSIRNETGSHVDVDGVSLLAGLSGSADMSLGRLTAGVFGEYGSGSYDTFNSFASGDVRGSGNSHYVGGGLLGHQEFGSIGPGHTYVEASARAGVAYNSFSSADLTSGGVAAGYETNSPYYGVSAAIGYVWSLGEAMTVDVSGKYIWSQLGSDSTRLSTGETVDFEAVNSERTRLGARVSYALSNKVTPYAGAAWEHEFDGKARATTNGLAIDAPSMAGDTGILEAGLTLKPSDDLPLSIDLGLQGFVGRREGIAGNFQAKLAF